MAKITFAPGDKVAVIENCEICSGIIRNIYGDLSEPIAIVEFEDGSVRKVRMGNLAKIREERNPNPEETAAEKSAPKEKSEITITPNQFQKIAVDVLTKCAKGWGTAGFNLGTIMTPVLAMIHKALFSLEAEE